VRGTVEARERVEIAREQEWPVARHALRNGARLIRVRVGMRVRVRARAGARARVKKKEVGVGLGFAARWHAPR
tara:strand:+ start:97 stop:315 length:219 start_codon:yes stop_codon:yes gene_type:complete